MAQSRKKILGYLEMVSCLNFVDTDMIGPTLWPFEQYGAELFMLYCNSKNSSNYFKEART